MKPSLNSLANVSGLNITDDKIGGAINFMVHTDEFYIPLNENIDPAAERERLNKERYLDGFLESVNTKLTNRRFIEQCKT